jgi:subtilase family serine protease
MSITIRGLGVPFMVALLTVCICPNASGQGWTSTATKAYPVQNLSNATLLGPLNPSTPLHIVVGLAVQNANQIQPTLLRMLTPGDSLYGTSLTVQQFIAQFGPTSAQVQAVQNYLSANGFANITVADNQLLIDADGTAAGVSTAFNTLLASYSVGGANVYVNIADAQVPASLAGVVVAVLGLNNVVAVHTDAHTLALNTSPAADPCTPPNCPTPAVANEVFGPQQYQIAYDAACPSDNPHCPAQNFTSASATAVGIIVEGDLTQVVKDLRTYEQTYKLPQVPVDIVNAGVASPDTSGAEEWDLDSQVSTGIAQQVSHLYFYTATTLTDSDLALAINKAVSENKVKSFNMSFGECEFSPYIDGAMLIDDEIFGEAALQGMTPFAASDDNGSACPAEGATNGVPLTGPPDTSYPASSPYVIAVGGTNLFTHADFTYDFETGWEASGGGPSYFENPPFWQSYTGSGTLPIVPSSEGSAVGMGRGVPDVSMCAGGTGLAICSANVFVSGTATLIGGTSLASPLAMGSWARIQTAHKNKLGFAGPLIYQLASGGPSPSSPDFNDVVQGGNGLFTALPGYDYVTGLGSWDIYRINTVIPSSYPQ